MLFMAERVRVVKAMVLVLYAALVLSGVCFFFLAGTFLVVIFFVVVFFFVGFLAVFVSAFNV